MVKYLSVCSGIEAATVAWHSLGWKPLAFSEIEKFPRKVLTHHYPDVRLEGDFTVLRNQDWIKDADILVGGTPCQAFSVAGLRNSLDDDRGNLTLEFVRLADAIDDLRLIGTIIVWENVPGVLSIKDNAFGYFLAALVGNDEPLVPTGGKWTNAGMVVGPKRRAAWRVLDAQYFGVAQRRRRVFVVASSRNDFDPAEVLFEREGLRRNTPPSRSEGKETAKRLTTGVGQRYDPETETLPIAVNSHVAGTLTSNTGGLTRPAGNANELDFCVVQPMVIHETQDPCVSDIAFAQGRNNGAENVVMQRMAVRRLTPRECERLQGFPDDYTDIPGGADGPRYKSLGNSMAVPVMAWIGKRINGEVVG